MSKKSKLTAVGLACCATAALAAGEAQTASERDYFADLPLVLTVSRLAQPLDETPGAVTIIDRDMIRMSGARNVAELMRFVPGFQVSDSVEALAPLVSYHGALHSFPNQMQVLIDGRSVYASYAIGSISPGLQTIDLEDIERIEVLRGSNSAAYGARAFLGVINIITRDPAATRGGYLAKRNGEDGINDNFARVGWGSGDASYRLSAGRRSDSGLAGGLGGSQVGNANFRGDLRLTQRDDLQLRAGASEQDQHVGATGAVGNVPRNRHEGLGFVQADWRRALAPDQDLLVSYSHGDERYADNFVYLSNQLPGALFSGHVLDNGGVASTDTLGVQHTFASGAATRVVWGGELRHEAVRSAPIYNTDAELATTFRRLYGNVEWRLARPLILNAGGMYEDSSLSGHTFAPRVMLNWHATPDQTFRIGASKAYRPPSIFEDRINQVVVGNPTPAFLFGLPGGLTPITPVAVLTTSTGTLKPEKLTSNEIGYLGEFRRLGLTADIRVFREAVGDYIGRQTVLAPGTFPLPLRLAAPANEYVNTVSFTIHGDEGQLEWRPWPGTRLLLGHADIQIDSNDTAFNTAAPRRSDSAMWMQQLPRQFEFTLMYFEASSVPWITDSKESWRRTDARLGKTFRFDGHAAEAAFVVQDIGPSYPEYAAPGQPVRFQRRAYVTLSLEI